MSFKKICIDIYGGKCNVLGGHTGTMVARLVKLSVSLTYNEDKKRNTYVYSCISTHVQQARQFRAWIKRQQVHIKHTKYTLMSEVTLTVSPISGTTTLPYSSDRSYVCGKKR